MLMIRLQRVGRKNDPSFRVVVMDSRKDSQSGKFTEILGSYNARHGKPQLQADRIKYWMGVGAQVSPTVHNLLVSEQVITGKKINVLPRKSPPVKEAEAKTAEAKTEEVKAEAPAAEVVKEETKEETLAEAPVSEATPEPVAEAAAESK